MKTLKESKPFIKTARTGKQVTWWLRLVQEGVRFGIQKAWTQEGSTIVQESEPRWSAPRSRDTAKAQAEFEFESLLERKQDRLDSGFVKPMLAHKFSGRKDGIKYPVCVQPKFDGHRMLMDGDKAWTRGQKEHKPTVNHLIFETGGYILDGEVMLPDNPLLQESSSAIKGAGMSDKRLHYYVYDVVVDKPYIERYELLKRIVLQNAPVANVHLAPTYVAETEEEVVEYQQKFVKAGFEGAIVRTNGSGYEIGARTDALLKVKDFQDEEFQVVSVNEGKGNNVGLAILEFDCGKGETFRAVPEGGFELRRKLWADRHDLLGKWWTVRYFYKSQDGIPVFPVAVAERED